MSKEEKDYEQSILNAGSKDEDKGRILYEKDVIELIASYTDLIKNKKQYNQIMELCDRIEELPGVEIGPPENPTWKFVKYRGDRIVYAQCECGYDYECYYTKRKQGIGILCYPDPEKLFKFCPNCGSNKEEDRKEKIKLGSKNKVLTLRGYQWEVKLKGIMDEWGV